MKRNMGKVDKTIRIVAGVVIIILGIVFKSWWGLIGVLPIAISVVGFCPVYAPFKISTMKKGKTS